VPDFYCDEVLSGRTPVGVVAESPGALAFEHTRPAYPVHIVVIPRTHVASITDNGASPEAARAAFELACVVAAGVEREHGACRLITNVGAYQESKHLHWHVVSGERLSGAPG
jgi:histidine triad (HIT) family protein